MPLYDGDQLAVAELDRRAGRSRVLVVAGVFLQRVGAASCRAPDATPSSSWPPSRRRGPCLALLLEGLGQPVDRLEAQQPVGRVTGDHLGQRRPVLVGQDDEAHAVVGEQAGSLAREAVDRPAVVDAAMAAVGVGPPAQSRNEAGEISLPCSRYGRSVICGVCRSARTAGLMIGLPASLPPWVCTATQRAISATLELIEPAGPTLVMSRNGITRTFPSCSSYGTGEVVGLLRVEHREVAGGHPQRPEDPCPDGVLPRAAVSFSTR